MAYKKRFSTVNTTGQLSPISGNNSNSGAWNGPGFNNEPTGGWNNAEFGYKNYMSRLPEVYTGHPNRIERYNQYEMMDVDAEINACLDIIAEFSTQRNEHNNTPFSLEFKDDPTPHEVELLKKQLQQWCKLNDFDNRIFKIFRNTIKYGDQFFVRDPENFKLYWVDATKVGKVIVNESEGKLPEQYVVKDINVNLQNLTVAAKTTTDFQAQPPTAGYSAPYSYTVPNEPYGTTGSRFSLGQNEAAVDAKHVVHLSLTEGLDRYWPFGQSILESIFKVYKQKELLEDAILIYRVSRAPERRVFKIDVGNMPSHMAMAFVDRVKNEIHQRRIPTSQGGSSVLDATYNPLSINEDYFFPTTADGRGSTVEMLQGGQNLGEIDDLKYFNNRLAQGDAEKLILLEQEKQKKLKEIKNAALIAEMQMASDALGSLIALNDSFTANSEKNAKRSFQINKALQLAQATINGVQSVMTVLADPTLVGPARYIAASIAGVTALANINKIAQTKFEPKGESGGGGGLTSNLGSFNQGGGGAPEGLTAQNTVTQLNPDGTIAGQGMNQQGAMKAYVVESESRAVTERINKLSNNSKIG